MGWESAVSGHLGEAIEKMQADSTSHPFCGPRPRRGGAGGAARAFSVAWETAFCPTPEL